MRPMAMVGAGVGFGALTAGTGVGSYKATATGDAQLTNLVSGIGQAGLWSAPAATIVTCTTGNMKTGLVAAFASALAVGAYGGAIAGRYQAIEGAQQVPTPERRS